MKAESGIIRKYRKSGAAAALVVLPRGQTDSRREGRKEKKEKKKPAKQLVRNKPGEMEGIKDPAGRRTGMLSKHD